MKIAVISGSPRRISNTRIVMKFTFDYASPKTVFLTKDVIIDSE